MAEVVNPTALEMLIMFYTKPDKRLVIDELSQLSLAEQLNILRIDNISTQKQRKELTHSLFDQFSNLNDNTDKRYAFESILSSYYKTYQELQVLPVTKWSKPQVAISLFVYVITYLRSTQAEKFAKQKPERAIRYSDCYFRFTYYLLRYCDEEQFDGESLQQLYDAITDYGAKPGGFGVKFIQKICMYHQLKFGKYAKMKKRIRLWVAQSVENSHEILVQWLVFGYLHESETKWRLTYDIPSGIAEMILSYFEKLRKHSRKSQSGANKPKICTKPLNHKHRKNNIAIVKHRDKRRVTVASEWYWMDMEEFQWVPYSYMDQRIINKAFNNGERRCNVSDGKYRIEFDADGDNAAGNQG